MEARVGLIAWMVVACTPATPSKSKSGEPTDRPAPATEPAARPEPPREEATAESAIHGITILPRSQMFTTSGPPSHVWFELTNASAGTAIQIVALEVAPEGDGKAVPIAIRETMVDDVVTPGALVPVASGTHVLDLRIDTSALTPDQRAYTFVLRAVVEGREVVVENTVHRARREPIRR